MRYKQTDIVTVSDISFLVSDQIRRFCQDVDEKRIFDRIGKKMNVEKLLNFSHVVCHETANKFVVCLIEAKKEMVTSVVYNDKVLGASADGRIDKKISTGNKAALNLLGFGRLTRNNFDSSTQLNGQKKLIGKIVKLSPHRDVAYINSEHSY